MKNFLWLLVLIPIISFSQEKTEEVVVVKSNKQIEEFTKSLGSDQLRVDFLDLLLFPALTVAYEKSKNSFSGFGSTLFLNLGNDSSAGDIYTQKFALTPYYRFYFLKSEDFGGKGIFVEVFTKLVSGKGLKSGNNIKTSYFDIAPGLAVGRKWINRNGFSFELLFGVGRNLLIGSGQNWETRTAGTLRMGVSVGKRF